MPALTTRPSVTFLVSVRSFGVMNDHALLLCSQIMKSEIRPLVKWTVSLVIADGHIYLPLNSRTVTEKYRM